MFFRASSSPQRVLASVLTLFLLLALLPAIAVFSASPAQATYATGGSGQYKGLIDWVQWGTNGGAIAEGTTKSTTRTVGGQSLVTSCTITNIAGRASVANNSRLLAYRPGSWQNDGLDDLYNIGGTGGSNQLINGITHAIDNDRATFNINCSATLDGVTVPLGGLVFADAEASNSNASSTRTEFVSARPLQGTVDWRIIERFRNASCSTANAVNAQLASGTLTLRPTAGECAGGGPMAIAYMKGSNSAAVTIQGGGKSAVALGVVFEADFGDAPASYGEAGALFQREWSGTKLSEGDNLVFGPNFQLGAPIQPLTRLGATIDADPNHQASPGATLDDTTNVDDEDAVGDLGTINAVPGQNYTLSSVQCTGPGYVAGWIDWNLNGKFDAGERSAAAECTGSSVALTWAVPNDAKKTTGAALSFLRLRIAATTAELASPTGMTQTGEVEDHALKINAPTITVQKNIERRVSSNDQFALSLRQGSTTLGTATTSGNSTGLQTQQVASIPVLPGQTYAFGETMAAGSAGVLADYNSQSQCTINYSGSSSEALPVQQGSQGTIAVPAYQAAKGVPTINCVISNAAKAADFTANKVWIINGQRVNQGSQPEGLSAQARVTVNEARDLAWGTKLEGIRSGQSISFNESTSIAAGMPGCKITDQKLTQLNGASVNRALPADLTMQTGSNTATITNTVDCVSTVTLSKQVVGGAADPQSWTLSAFNQAGAATIEGKSGVRATVPADQRLELAEAGGPAEYVQDDSRTTAERTAAPRSTGSWQCLAVDAQGKTVAGILPERAGTNGTVTPPLGADLRCTAVNRTAQMTLLKFVENVNGTGTAQPSDWELTATPKAGIPGLADRTVAGSSTLTSNTFLVRPGHEYAVNESSDLGGYTQVAFEKFTGTDPTQESQLIDPRNWAKADRKSISAAVETHTVYRFVNRDVPAFALPLTGSTGSWIYVVGGVLIAVIAVAAAIYRSRRSRKDL
ncbi:CshA/CshB family fibrillar adhesin-related protein [Glutamicibacter sp. NPDC087661]|uniref:CshA/CshB family fibrillar adhesin-related protein n=1 Tax=Glutamicibacter sp. NPDC087661 TaxID=3363996 RepID=UPI0037FFE2B5